MPPRPARTMLSVLLALASAVPLAAQGPRHFARADAPSSDATTIRIAVEPAPSGRVTGKAVLGASLGLVVGFVGGAVLGAALEDDVGCDDQCGLAGAIAGAAVGPTIGVPLGLYLADANPHVLESLGISAVLGVVAAASVEDRPEITLAVPGVRLLIALIAKR